MLAESFISIINQLIDMQAQSRMEQERLSALKCVTRRELYDRLLRAREFIRIMPHLYVTRLWLKKVKQQLLTTDHSMDNRETYQII